MRDTFSDFLLSFVKENEKAYVLSGDHGYALFDKLRRYKQERFINAGVAEQNLVGVGAGMSKLGLYPIMYGLAAFIPIRVLEQIKIDFCYEDIPGLFIGDGAGVVYSHLGASHQSTEDIASLRGIPHINILSPCDKYELLACLDWAVRQRSPVYLRLGKADLGEVHLKPLKSLEMKPLSVIKSSVDTAIFATGSMVKTALKVLESGHFKADVYSVPVLKASGADMSVIAGYQNIITMEEHSVYGGLGDIVASKVAELGRQRLLKIGIQDKFSNLCGSYNYLIREHALDAESIEKRILSWVGSL